MAYLHNYDFRQAVVGTICNLSAPGSVFATPCRMYKRQAQIGDPWLKLQLIQHFPWWPARNSLKVPKVKFAFQNITK